MKITPCIECPFMALKIYELLFTERVKKENMDGKFNMKFDKLQNTYKTLYKKFVKA
jgi:hypothetical protein